ncbi:TetR/AcrR family transcriptional regulator [Ferrimonas marina]|uniref:Transcriptional regulator, TetR family n=1 Tax=Ferrimonas marina TaxID=299255 RepID=A0A1M5ZUA6_9GAMM|nr:TetR/AcrR family transcriptional regulator [Ferrimonas marina]SHI27523.1 transcriptional regulator, TetR family [Ferrimonas marina]
MGTRERILDTSLALFNQRGTAGISSLEIATELGISPGNLYYHFRGKEEILAALMAECELALGRLIHRIRADELAAEDYDPLLHSVFRVCHHFRFLFRDQEALRFAKAPIPRRWHRLMAQLKAFAQALVAGMDALQPLGLSAARRDALAEALMLTTLGSLSFDAILDHQEDEAARIRLGIDRLAVLLAPYAHPAVAKLEG